MKTPWKSLIIVALCAAVSTPARAADPVPGKSPRYCNPLPMVSGGGASASGDVTVIRDNGKYLHVLHRRRGVDFRRPGRLDLSARRQGPVAPHVVKYKGAFYMGGNDGPLFKADNPLGPYTNLGDVEEHTGRGRRMERRVRHRHLCGRRQPAVSLLSRPGRQRHLRRAVGPQ